MRRLLDKPLYTTLVLRSILAIAISSVIMFLYVTVSALSPGGQLLSWMLIAIGIAPWQATVGISVVAALVALAFAASQRYSRQMRLGVGMVATAALAATGIVSIFGASTLFKASAPSLDFVVARYKHNVDDRQLIFLGEQHIAHLEAYKKIENELVASSLDGYEMFYEDTNAHEVCKNFYGDMINYGEQWWRFYIDVVRTPLIWVSVNMKKTRVDLGRTDEEVSAIGAAQEGMPCFKAVVAARDRNLFRKISEANAPGKLVILYGSAHWAPLNASLLTAGWSVVGEPMWFSAWSSQ